MDRFFFFLLLLAFIMVFVVVFVVMFLLFYSFPLFNSFPPLFPSSSQYLMGLAQIFYLQDAWYEKYVKRLVFLSLLSIFCSSYFFFFFF